MLATLNPDWSDQYVQYNVLKKQIKDVSQVVQRTYGDDGRLESDYPEGRALLEHLTEEVHKVDAFYRAQERQLATMLELFLASDPKTPDLRARIAKYFTELVQLRDFAQLNYTAVNKILKKHDKYLPFKIRQAFMREHITPLPVFGPLDTLSNLMSRTQMLYADLFEEGNRHLAADRLEEAVRQATKAFVRRGPEAILEKRCFIIDMDGVIYHGDRLLPGVHEFLDWVERSNKRFLFLTNGSARTPVELQAKLKRLGLDVPADVFHTSAISTAMFLASQTPNGSAYVIGDNGLRTAIVEAGLTITDKDPDYVVVGETRTYSFDQIEAAVNMVMHGARLIGTNCDNVDNATQGFTPACASLIAPIERATGKTAYFVGKPNALMFRTAAQKLHAHSSECIMIGDRMDTDIVGGLEAGMDTVLVLSGITKVDDIAKFAYRPTHVLQGLADVQNIIAVDQ